MNICASSYNLDMSTIVIKYLKSRKKLFKKYPLIYKVGFIGTWILFIMIIIALFTAIF